LSAIRSFIPPGDPHHPSESPKLLPTLLWALLHKFRILLRVADLELAAQQRCLGVLSISEPSDDEANEGFTEARLSALLAMRGVGTSPSGADYYDRPREERCADSIAQPCKIIVMVWPSSSLFVRFIKHFVCVTALGWLLLHSCGVLSNDLCAHMMLIDYG
jgi:hypothetical protein